MQKIKEDIMKNKKLMRKDHEIKQIFMIFVALAVNLLPFYASDFPENDKSQFYQIYCQWNSMKDKIIDIMVKSFCRSDT